MAPHKGMPPQAWPRFSAFVGALNVYWAVSLDRSAYATGYVRATPVACSMGSGVFSINTCTPEGCIAPHKGMPPHAFVGALNVYWAGSLIARPTPRATYVQRPWLAVQGLGVRV